MKFMEIKSDQFVFRNMSFNQKKIESKIRENLLSAEPGIYRDAANNMDKKSKDLVLIKKTELEEQRKKMLEIKPPEKSSNDGSHKKGHSSDKDPKYLLKKLRSVF